MLNDAVFGSDDEFPGVALCGVRHDLSGASGEVGKLYYLGTALGVNEQQRVRVELLSRADIGGGELRVGRAAAVDKLDLFLGDLLLHEIAEVAVRNEQYFVSVELLDYLNCRGGGHADVGEGLERRGGVDVGDDLVVGVHLPELSEHFNVELLRHRAAGFLAGDKHALLRREYLHGLSHEAYAAHHDGSVGSLRCFLCKSEGIADEISHFENVVGLVAVR